MEMTTLRSEYNLAICLNSFESGTLPKATWTHDAHIAVATLYLLRHHDGALSKTRNAIRRYNESVGTPNTAKSAHSGIGHFRIQVLLLKQFKCALKVPVEGLRMTMMEQER